MQFLGVTEPLGSRELAVLGHKVFQLQRSLLLLLPVWVFGLSLLAAARVVPGHRSESPAES